MILLHRPKHKTSCMRTSIVAVFALTAGLLQPAAIRASEPEAKPAVDTSRGDRMIDEYFKRETRKITKRNLDDVTNKSDWTSQRGEYRSQLFEMLGLDPRPEKTPLEPVVTDTVERDGIVVENLHFQSRPQLYVTGNLYRPKKVEGRLPTILYVCGHGGVKKDGVSYGNKVHYQHHGAWFARNGYVCLTIDTLQLGEIEGRHHGTYKFNDWWWNARGYTPAGVEAWNCIRALDYLETRPEVDATRFGVTGRSGGGAYSWWIAALDDRVKVSVPVAGITSLENHVVDGCVEGHCDCMYMVNTYRWDFPQVASLVAPRPLLISNTDKDRIFPLDGVVDVYFKTRRIYDLLGARQNLGLQITEGPHKDTQELRVHAFHWMNRFLKGEDPLIETVAVKLFEPEELKVFDKLPEDEINTKISETFTKPAAEPTVPGSIDEWNARRESAMKSLRQKVFRGWPDAVARGDDSEVAPLQLHQGFNVETNGVALSAYDFTSQESIRLRLYLAHRAGLNRSELEWVVLNVLDQQGWEEFAASFKTDAAGEPADKAVEQAARLFKDRKWAIAWVAPRGVGPTEWNRDDRKRIQIRRRFMLLGQTLDGMRVYDAVRAAQALRTVEGMREVPLWMQGQREAAGITLYASLFTPGVKRLDLHGLSKSHREGPILLNVLRFLDVPEAVAVAAENSQIHIHQDDESGWEYPLSVSKGLNWSGRQIQIHSGLVR